MNDQGIQIPAWILGLFGVTVLGGILFVAVTAFMSCDKPAKDRDFRAASGKEIVAPVVVEKPEKTDAAIANGEQNYAMACIACHGANQEGGVGPNLSDAEWVHGDTESSIFRTISRGVSLADAKLGQVAMPAKGTNPAMTDAQAWEIVYFLASKNKSIKAE